MLIDRYDKNGIQIKVGNILLNDNGKHYKVTFSEDIIAVGIVDEYGMFDFMSEWVADEWEVCDAY